MSSSLPTSARQITRSSTEDLPDTPDYLPDDTIDLRELFFRWWRGFYQIVGLGLLGLSITAAGVALFGQFQKADTSTRVMFSFPGFERGEYPDRSKFQADDLRAPAIVAEAMRRLGLDTSDDAQSKIRNALSIEGIIPDSVVKTRDRLRAAGQIPPAYTPDEYTLTLTLARNAPLSQAQRAHLLTEIVNVFHENFQRTYGQLPIAFGTAFETLRGADLPEYEIVFNAEINNLSTYLNDQIETAKSFRSPTTNMSFKDLLEQVNLFSQLQLNEVLGVIHENGLARSRQTAILKMDYYLKQLGYQEQRALQEEKVVRDLLEQAQARDQNYVLGVKSQALARNPGQAPILDQGLIDSLMANDSYNFLIHRALDAGLNVKRIQADKVRLTELRDNLQSFVKSAPTDQSVVMEQAQKSLAALETAYTRLVTNVRKTYRDFADQEYGHAIQISAAVRTTSLLKSLAMAGIVGAFLGAAFGSGLSLLGVYLGKGAKG